MFQLISLEDFIEIEESMRILHCERKTIYKWVSEGRIPHYKSGRKLLFRKSELIEYIESRRVKTRDELEKESRRYRKGLVN